MGNLTKLLKENTVVNFPSYVALLTKTLTDQTEEINKLRSFSDEESQIEVQMTEVLEEMRELNVTFSTDIEEWDLLGSLMELTKVQSDSLSALKPTISYIVNNNRGFDYQVNEKGLLQSISSCQCLPRTENTSLALSGIQFSCPAGTADTLSGEKDGIVKCLGAGCPTTLTDDLCDKRFGICIAANFVVKTKRALKSVNQGEQLGSLPLKVSSKFLNKNPAI